MRAYAKIKYGDIRKAIKEKVTDPIIAVSKNPDVMRLIANEGIRIVTPYVPKRRGFLRDSAHVIYHEKQVQMAWGDMTVVEDYITKTGKRRVVKTPYYAKYQHSPEEYGVDDSNWTRTTQGTKSHWTEEIMPGTPGFERLVKYATPLVKKEIKRASK